MADDPKIQEMMKELESLRQQVKNLKAMRGRVDERKFEPKKVHPPEFYKEVAAWNESIKESQDDIELYQQTIKSAPGWVGNPGLALMIQEEKRNIRRAKKFRGKTVKRAVRRKNKFYSKKKRVKKSVVSRLKKSRRRMAIVQKMAQRRSEMLEARAEKAAEREDRSGKKVNRIIARGYRHHPLVEFAFRADPQLRQQWRQVEPLVHLAGDAIRGTAKAVGGIARAGGALAGSLPWGKAAKMARGAAGAGMGLGAGAVNLARKASGSPAAVAGGAIRAAVSAGTVTAKVVKKTASVAYGAAKGAARTASGVAGVGLGVGKAVWDAHKPGMKAAAARMARSAAGATRTGMGMLGSGVLKAESWMKSKLGRMIGRSSPVASKGVSGDKQTIERYREFKGWGDSPRGGFGMDAKEWKDLVQHLEKVADKLEDAADSLSDAARNKPGGGGDHGRGVPAMKSSGGGGSAPRSSGRPVRNMLASAASLISRLPGFLR